jgi:hypothetical protein
MQVIEVGGGRRVHHSIRLFDCGPNINSNFIVTP